MNNHTAMLKDLRRRIFTQKSSNMFPIFGISLSPNENIFHRFDFEDNAEVEVVFYQAKNIFYDNAIAYDAGQFSGVQYDVTIHSVGVFANGTLITTPSVISRNRGTNVISVSRNRIRFNNSVYNVNLNAGGVFNISHNGGYTQGQGQGSIYTEINVTRNGDVEHFLPYSNDNGEVFFLSDKGNKIEDENFVREDNAN